MQTKEQIIDTLKKFAGQRSGIDPRDYFTSAQDEAGRSALNADMLAIAKQGRDAKKLIRAIELSGITAEDIVRESAGQRLEIDGITGSIDFAACQYFPTEYRAAVCRLCSALLWNHHRDDFTTTAKKDERAGDAIRRKFRLWFGRSIANRWFS